MHFLPVWFYLTCLQVFSYIARRIERQRLFITYCYIAVLKRTPLKLIFGWLHFIRVLGLTSKKQRVLSLIASENKRCLLDDENRTDFTWIAQRRKALNFAATYGRNKLLLGELSRCASQLDHIVKPLHQARKPVILAPMHMVSDILAGIVASQVYPYNGTVIVSANAEQYAEEHRRRGGVNLQYCSIHDTSEGVANNMLSACMKAAENKTNIIIFPDITPDYTLHETQGHSSKLNCQLFGRPGRLHNGVVRLAKMLSAEVVFYYLYYEKGVRIHIYPPVLAKEVSEKLPDIIEHSISAQPQDWLLWHRHTLYFINE